MHNQSTPTKPPNENQDQEKAENIKVLVRVRPLNELELTISDYETIRILDQQTVVITNPTGGLELQSDQMKDYESEFNYTSAFDKISSQKEVFESVISQQVDELFQGYNVAISSYGTTGSGKTFTMLNNQDNPGIIPRSLNQLFSSIELIKDSKQVVVLASIIEIHNENLRDLQQNKDVELDIREDPIRGVVIHNVIEKVVSSTTEIMNLLKLSVRNRTAENFTSKSSASSKSHEFLIITMEVRNKNDMDVVTITKLQLIDLGGSEKGVGKGTKINTSLTVLVNCIQSLYEGKEKGMNFIPYRNSKLTRLMKESLGGNCKTTFVACISPAVNAYDETVNTLVYAKKLLSIQNLNKQNIAVASAQTSTNYVSIIEKLKIENNELKKLVTNASNSIIDQIIELLPGINQINEDAVKLIHEKIDQHFQTEKELNQQIFTYETECTKICIRQEQYPDQKLTDRLTNIRIGDEVAQDEKQLEEYQKKLEEANKKFKIQSDNRSLLYAEIASSELTSTNQNYLILIIKQGVLNIENQEIKQSEQRNALIKEQQEKELDMLRSQLQLRDNIIHDHNKYLTKESKFTSQHQNDIKTTQQIMVGSKQATQPLHNEFVNHSYFNKKAYPAQSKYIEELSKSRYENIRSKSPIKVNAHQHQYQSQRINNKKGKHQYSNTTIPNNSSLPTLVTKSKIINTQPIYQQSRDSISFKINLDFRAQNNHKFINLPPIKSKMVRDLNKFEYDWVSGGYNLKVSYPNEVKKKKNDPNIPKQDEMGSTIYSNFSNINSLKINRNSSPQSNNRHYSPGKSMHKSFYKYQLQNNSMQPQRPSSGLSQHESPQGHDVLVHDHRVLLPGQVEESPYVKSFLKDQEISRRKRLVKLNQHLKLQQDIEDKAELSQSQDKSKK